MQVRTARASRRAVAGGVGAASALAAVGSAAGHRARTSYRPAHYRGGPKLLGTQARHLVGRFSYGVTPALAAEVRRAGGALAWFEPSSPPARSTTGAPTSSASWWPSLYRSATEIWHRQRQRDRGRLGGDGRLPALGAAAPDAVPAPGARGDDRALGEPLQRAGQRRRRSAPGAPSSATRSAAHALGRFDDLLHAVITHPAMLINLDNVSSTGRSPQREPRPRAARAAHRRPRRVRRGRREELRPDPHRLDASTCGTPSTAVYAQEVALDGARCRSSASSTRTAAPTGAPVTRDVPHATSPTTRRRPGGWRASSR